MSLTELKNLYSKTKDIYIPVTDYSYFHSPSSLNKKDNRMVGRKELIKKIQGLLNNSKTKSGAYLITGYRGVGKTSLVNNALRGIVDIPPLIKPLYQHFLGLFYLFILVLFNEWEHIDLVSIVVFIVVFFTLLILANEEIKIIHLKKKAPFVKKESWKNLGIKFLPFFRSIIRPSKKQEGLVLLILGKLSIATFSFIIWDWIKIELFFLYALTVISSEIIYLALKLILIKQHYEKKWYSDDNKVSFIKEELPKRLFDYLRTIKSTVKNRLNYGNRISINLNLGHERLTEEDILRLIAKKLYSKYKRFLSIYWSFPLNTHTLRTIVLILLGLMLGDVLKSYATIGSVFPDITYPSALKIMVNGLYKIACVANDFFISLSAIIRKNHFLSVPIFPSHIDWYAVVSFFVLVMLGKLISGTNFIIFSTHARVFKRLETLIERISAQITKENNGKVNGSFSFLNLGLSKRKAAHYPLADVREIESELISIFEEIDRIPLIFGRPSFVFVLDELDKIESAEYNQKNNVDDNNQFTSSDDIIRKRNHVVAALLANLKHFLTTVRAKFILIAGREMYDASLADISDRNYFLGSIFHEIIYVNSLLTEKTEDPDPKFKDKPNHQSYFHNSIELFVCQFLLPTQYRPHESRSLKTLSKRFIEIKGIAPFGEEKNLTSDHTDILEVIISIRNFIYYLSYRCGGMPKKLGQIFEQHLVTIKGRGKRPYQNGFYKEAICIEDFKENGLYLRFTQNELYMFGLVYYLTVPFYYNISKHIRNFGDKLMVSSSYLLDHFYKFHNHGFSWRNLELTPEIVDINKAPVLRKIIGDIIDFLTYTNLERVSSGLYDFKFNSRIAQEIDYLSKISEKESAAFNFTLDESQEIKKHYKKKLKDISDENPIIKSSLENAEQQIQFLHSVTMIKQSLGDLYYYDQEYDDAIVAYQNAIFTFRDIYFKEHFMKDLPEDMLIIYIRIALKLGNALERKKTSESALMNYITICDAIVGNIERGPQGITFNKMTIEGIRHIFQPFLAKLYAIEKVKKTGIDHLDIANVFDELEKIISKCENENFQHILRMEYWNKIGDLVHYKNVNSSWLDDAQSNHFDDYEKGKYPCLYFYSKALKSYEAYLKKKFPAESNDYDSIIDLLEYLIEQELYKNTTGFEESKNLANCLSDYAESLLATLLDYTGDNGNLKRFVFTEIFDVRNKGLIKIHVLNSNDFENIVKNIVRYFLLAYKLHYLNDDHKRAAFQYLKILHLIAARCDFSKQVDLKLIKDVILEDFLLSVYRAYSSSTRPEIERLKSIFKINGPLDSAITPYFFKKLPISGEIQEALSLYQFIELKVKKDYKFEHKVKDLSPGHNMEPTNMYSRLVQLSVKVRFNKDFLRFVLANIKEECKSKERKERNEIIRGKEEQLTYAIADSIYCLTEMIRIIQNFGGNYAANNSFFGFAYEQRATWIKWYGKYIEYADRSANQSDFDAYPFIMEGIEKKPTIAYKYKRPPHIYNLIRRLIGAESMDKLNPMFNIEKAVSYYTKCVEVHEGKFVYDTDIINRYYLDDMFNDEYMHFYLSLERSKLQRIKNKIKTLSEELESSKVYTTNSYFIDHNT